MFCHPVQIIQTVETVTHYKAALDKLRESSEDVSESFDKQYEAMSSLSDVSLPSASDYAPSKSASSSQSSAVLNGFTSLFAPVSNSVLSDANGQRVTKATLYSEAEAIRRDQLRGKDVTEAWDALNEKKRLFGFASGGSFMVGGSGGTDSQLVQFRASPNERVTIETPAQQKQSAASAVFNITMNGVNNVQQFVKELEQFSRTTPININVGTRQTVAG